MNKSEISRPKHPRKRCKANHNLSSRQKPTRSYSDEEGLSRSDKQRARASNRTMPLSNNGKQFSSILKSFEKWLVENGVTNNKPDVDMTLQDTQLAREEDAYAPVRTNEPLDSGWIAPSLENVPSAFKAWDGRLRFALEYELRIFRSYWCLTIEQLENVLPIIQDHDGLKAYCIYYLWDFLRFRAGGTAACIALHAWDEIETCLRQPTGK